jgi:hypothetical protein
MVRVFLPSHKIFLGFLATASRSKNARRIFARNTCEALRFRSALRKSDGRKDVFMQARIRQTPLATTLRSGAEAYR